MIVADPPPPLSSARADAPGELEAIILRCLEKDRERRYASVAALARALERFATAETKPLVRRISRVLGEDAPPVTEVAPIAPLVGFTVNEPVAQTNGTWARTGRLREATVRKPFYQRSQVQVGAGVGVFGIALAAWLLSPGAGGPGSGGPGSGGPGSGGPASAGPGSEVTQTALDGTPKAPSTAAPPTTVAQAIAPAVAVVPSTAAAPALPATLGAPAVVPGLAQPGIHAAEPSGSAVHPIADGSSNSPRSSAGAPRGPESKPSESEEESKAKASAIAHPGKKAAAAAPAVAAQKAHAAPPTKPPARPPRAAAESPSAPPSSPAAPASTKKADVDLWSDPK